MAISVQVPKDLSGIKTKVALNLTKRQIICFSGAAVADNLHTALWSVAAYTVILCFSLFKTGSLSKAIWNAH